MSKADNKAGVGAHLSVDWVNLKPKCGKTTNTNSLSKNHAKPISVTLVSLLYPYCFIAYCLNVWYN